MEPQNPSFAATGTGSPPIYIEDVLGDQSPIDINVTGITGRNIGETQLILVDPDSLEHLISGLQEALNEIRQLRTELSQRPLVTSITLNDLGDSKINIKLPISSVILHETDEESIARWPETRAYGTGSTLGEAISALKLNIIDLYCDLKNRDSDSLGVIALNTLRIFETHLQVA